MDQTNDNLINNEHDLFAKLAGGSEKAFVQIYWRYTKRLYPFILKMVHDEEKSEDIIQDIFVQLWEKREQLLTVHHPTSYLFQIASNKTLNYLKQESNHARILDQYAKARSELVKETENTIDLNETNTILRQAIDSLPDQRKLIFKMSRDEGLSNDEIAIRLGISKQTVKNQIVTSLKNIRLYMEQRQALFSFALFFLMTKK
jgi:RNA polymerase sigma-70 factor (family 1)